MNTVEGWKLIDIDRLPGGAELAFYTCGDEFMIRADGLELMTSSAADTEKFLVDEAIAFMEQRPIHSVLIGGLGLGFTLEQACQALPPSCQITVVEISTRVIAWVGDYMGASTGACLKDPRVKVVNVDFVEYLRDGHEPFDAILADIDNGPVAMVHPGNERLYHGSGLEAVQRRLTPQGVALFWSGIDDPDFLHTLAKSFNHVEKRIFPLPQAHHISHTLYLASP